MSILTEVRLQKLGQGELVPRSFDVVETKWEQGYNTGLNQTYEV